MKKFNSICIDRDGEDVRDPESAEAALAPLRQWRDAGMPDPIPEALIAATMKNSKTSRSNAIASWKYFRSERQVNFKAVKNPLVA